MYILDASVVLTLCPDHHAPSGSRARPPPGRTRYYPMPASCTRHAGHTRQASRTHAGRTQHRTPAHTTHWTTAHASHDSQYPVLHLHAHHTAHAGAWLEPHDVEEPLSGPAAQPAAGPATANKAGQQAWGTQNANAEQLPSTAHRPGARPIAATPLRSSVGAAATPGEALSASPGSDLHPGALTPLEVERRAAEVQRTLHPSHHKHPMHAHAGGAGGNTGHVPTLRDGQGSVLAPPHPLAWAIRH